MKKTVLLVFVFLVVLSTVIAQETYPRGPTGPVVFPSPRLAIEETAANIFSHPLIWILIALTVIWYSFYKKAKTKENLRIGIGVITVFLIVTIILGSNAIESSMQATYWGRGPSGPVEIPSPGREFPALKIESFSQQIISHPITWILIVLSFFLALNYKLLRRTNTLKIYGSALLIVWIVFIIFLAKPIEPEQEPVDWQRQYRIAMGLNGISDRYTEETEFYDYSHPEIQQIIQKIKERATTPTEAAEMALDYVYKNIAYTYTESDEVCFNSRASDVLKRKTGQCDTQGTLVIAITRGLGIATRPIGGCVYSNPYCEIKFSMYSIFGMDYLKPIWQDVPLLDPLPETFSRGQDRSIIIVPAPRSGGLHLWLELWLPEEGGWIIGEETAGKLVKDQCFTYEVELEVEDDDRLHFCVSTDAIFALACSKK